MAVTYKVPAVETTYTAAPDSTAGDSMKTLGVGAVEAILRVTAIGGSADQVLTIRPQHSIGATGPWENVGSHLAFIIPGTGSIVGLALPLIVHMRFAPTREHLRWNFAHTGATRSITYGLETVYRSEAPPSEAIWADGAVTSSTTGVVALATTFGPWPLFGLRAWSLVERNTLLVNALTANNIAVSNAASFPAATAVNWAVIDTSMAALAANSALAFRSQQQTYRWLRVQSSSVTTDLSIDFFGIPL